MTNHSMFAAPRNQKEYSDERKASQDSAGREEGLFFRSPFKFSLFCYPPVISRWPLLIIFSTTKVTSEDYSWNVGIFNSRSCSAQMDFSGWTSMSTKWSSNPSFWILS